MVKTLDFTKQIFKGRTIYRILFNWEVKKNCYDLKGKTLDLAAGSKASYYEYLSPNLEIIKTDCKNGKGIDKIVDFNQILPFEDNFFDNILFFNALYIVEDRVKLLKEMKRILKSGGKIFIASPFIANEMPEPHDYCRLTYEGLKKEFKEAGFENFDIKRFGERFSCAVYLLHPLLMFNIVRFFVYGFSLFFDQLIPPNIKKKYPTPLGYFCILEK